MLASWLLANVVYLSAWYCGFSVNPCAQDADQNQLPEIVHHIVVSHPGVSLDDTVSCRLVERKNDQSSFREFYLNVASVSCGDTQCKVDTVMLFWDELGRYDRLELPKGIDLEKAEGQSFTKKDYAKLDATLSDANSPLRDVFKNEIVGTVGGEGIDALSGATVSLDKSSYVAGAVWTCYTLWHWVHGAARDSIRNITGDGLTVASLLVYLNSEDPVYRRFALEQLTRRKDDSQQTVDAVLFANEKYPDLAKMSMVYWRQASDVVYSKGLLNQIKSCESDVRLICLHEILNSKRELPESFYESLITSCSNSTYEEVHVLLSMLKQRKRLSPWITAQLLLLLDSDDFLIARAVYWFLATQHLNEDQTARLQAFYKTKKDKL